MAALEHTYAYAAASQLTERELGLATSGGMEAHPALFSGWLERPATHAAALLAVGRTARARFTPGTAELTDPVVTCHRGLLRFEALSSCCGVYARYDLDLEPGAAVRPGATNVDFNPPLRAALAAVGDTTPIHLAVGAEELAVTTETGTVVERQVALPHRWVKGLGEAGVAQAAMDARLELSGPVAQRILRSLPRAGGPGRLHVGRGGVTASARAGSLALEGAERLRLLAPLLRHATRLRGFGSDSGASAWLLDLPAGRFQLVLSPERWRGFSGEGGVLDGLADEDLDALAEQLAGRLDWEPAIDTGASDEVLAGVGARGRAGFDLHTGRWFHRELPFDLERVPALHPRLAAARELAGRVRLGDGEAWVPASGGAEHRVVVGEERCSCPWWGRHAGARGPCKHVLAARIARDRAR